MNNISLEESGWILDYNRNGTNTPLANANGSNIPPVNQQFALIDSVGPRGIIHFNKSDIRAFMVLFKRFLSLEEQARKEFTDSELFDDDTTIAEQVANKKLRG